MLCTIKMYRLAVLLIIVLVIVRVMYYEKYTRALDDAHVPTRNSRRVSGVFNVCSPESGGCDRTTFPVEGLPLA
jgi:hypothetical protein